MFLSRFVKRLVFGASLVAAQAPFHAAVAEIDLGDWNTYATMAEQGAVCGAFADIMAMQSLVDEKLGRLWTERRNYSGSVIRRAASLEGLPDISDDDIDILLNRYSMWLLNNLASPANAEILSPDARDAARNMVADVCATLYTQADKAIIQKHPTLASCSAATSNSLSLEAEAAPQRCDANEALLAAATVKKTEEDLAAAILRLSEEEVRRRDAQKRSAELETQIATLNAKLGALRDGADAARDTAARAVELNLDNDQLKAEIGSLQQQLSDLKAIDEEKAAVTAQNGILSSRIAALEADIAGLTQQLETAEQRISALPTPEELAAARTDTAKARADLATVNEELARVRSDRDDAVAAFDAAIGPESVIPLEAQTEFVEFPAQDTGESDGSLTSGGAPSDLALLEGEAMEGLAALPTAFSDASMPPLETVSEEADETLFVAQLGAFRSRTGAVSEIANLEQAFPDQLATAGLSIAADRRADGQDLFRIMTTGMTAEDARILCSTLWDRMVGCMVKMVP